MSALRHGLTGQIVVMPDEDLAAYRAFVKTFVDAHKPQGPDEQQCVQAMADTSWKVNRAKAWTDHMVAQKALVESGADELPEDNGPELNAALAIAAVVARITKDLCNMSMYEQRQWKMYGSAHDRLRMMQKERREREQAELEEAAMLLEIHEAAEEVRVAEEQDRREADPAYAQTPDLPACVPAPYNPQPDGFVFQVAEIKLHIRRRDRLALAELYRREGSQRAIRAFAEAA